MNGGHDGRHYVSMGLAGILGLVVIATLLVAVVLLLRMKGIVYVAVASLESAMSNSDLLDLRPSFVVHAAGLVVFRDDGTVGAQAAGNDPIRMAQTPPAASGPPFRVLGLKSSSLESQWRRIEASHRVFVGKQAEVVGAVRRLPCLRLWDQEDVSARRQPMVARQQRHFVSFLAWADGLRRNPLAIPAVTVSIAAIRLVGEARRRMMGVGHGGDRHPDRRKYHSHGVLAFICVAEHGSAHDPDRTRHSLPSKGLASAATGRLIGYLMTETFFASLTSPFCLRSARKLGCMPPS